ncbi:MAG: PEGA domain-containing protein [Bacteroides sp.]
MRLFVFIIFMLTLALYSAQAQQMQVEGFVRLKHRFGASKSIMTDKKLALIDFNTNEKGFTFKLGEEKAVTAEEKEGKITLRVPNKTTYIMISHSNYGQLAWKIPGKPLKKKKHYEANLFTFSPDKEFKISRQWTVFYVEPRNALLTVDTATYVMRKGKLQLLLPVGKHSCKIEAPFYNSFEDFIEVKKEEKLETRIKLEPFYSYLKVNTKIPKAEIRLDGELLGYTNTTSQRIMPGRYRLTVIKENWCYYDDSLRVKASEKKVVDLTQELLQPQLMAIPRTLEESKKRKRTSKHREISPEAKPLAVSERKLKEEIKAPIEIKAFDYSTEIWINREPVGKGSWKGTLKAGFYAVSSRKDSLESRTHYLWIDDNRPKELNLASPLADYGALNLSSNEVDAMILLNDLVVGRTPCIITNLPVNKHYAIKLKKKGFKETKKKVLLRGNEMVNVKMILKK